MLATNRKATAISPIPARAPGSSRRRCAPPLSTQRDLPRQECWPPTCCDHRNNAFAGRPSLSTTVFQGLSVERCIDVVVTRGKPGQDKRSSRYGLQQRMTPGISNHDVDIGREVGAMPVLRGGFERQRPFGARFLDRPGFFPADAAAHELDRTGLLDRWRRGGARIGGAQRQRSQCRCDGDGGHVELCSHLVSPFP